MIIFHWEDRFGRSKRKRIAKKVHFGCDVCALGEIKERERKRMNYIYDLEQLTMKRTMFPS
jgi:hypothetical protein